MSKKTIEMQIADYVIKYQDNHYRLAYNIVKERIANYRQRKIDKANPDSNHTTEEQQLSFSEDDILT